MKSKKLISILIFVGLFIFVISLSFIPVGETDPRPQMEIYLISNSIHTDIIVPVQNDFFDWSTFIDPGQFPGGATDWMLLGWGDRRFYFEVPTWDKFTLGIGLDALFTPDQGIMHVEFLPKHPFEYDSVIKIGVSFLTYLKLVEALKAEFVLKNERPVLIPDKGYGPRDNFYEGRGNFSLLRTCNVWTADMLGKANLQRPIWAPTKHGLEFVWKMARPYLTNR